MRLRYIALAVLVLTATQLAASLPQLPLTFEPNHGQAPEGVRFLAHRSGYTVYLSETDAVLLQKSTWLRAHLVGANERASMSGLEQLNATSNYFVGNDPQAWRRSIPNYARVVARNVYDGIDLTWYGRDGQLEYDFVVAPGADVKAIEIEFLGAQKITIEKSGDLLLHTEGGIVRQRKPVVYQEQREIKGRYVRRGANRVGFSVASYDRSKELVIDPVLVYSTYVGGSSFDVTGGIAVDGSGNAYIVGSTASFDFPILGAMQDFHFGGDTDIYITKLNSSGTLAYSTYLGGMGSDRGIRIAVDAAGNAYVVGETNSMNFPIANAVQSFFMGGNADAFLVKLNATGSVLDIATYLGGSEYDSANGVAVDSASNIYLAGVTHSVFFPTAFAMQSTLSGVNDAFVTKIAAGGLPLVYSTFLGGSSQDVATRIRVDSSGNAYVAGFTDSSDFPTVNAFRSTASSREGFVSKLDASGSALIYSTYLGGSSGDQVNSLVIDGSGNAYVAGMTTSADFPTLNPVQPALSGFSDGFVSKLSAAGNALVFSTYNGGSGDEEAKDLALDAAGNVHVIGSTSSTDLVTVNAVQNANGGADDGWVTKLSASGSSRVYSTYVGGGGFDYPIGAAVDSAGDLYVIGETTSSNFPTVNAFQGASGGDIDAFVVKLHDEPVAPPPPPPPPPPPTERFNGGGQRSDVNEFLTYSSPTAVETTLPAGTKTFDVHIHYGKTIKSSTFLAELNGWIFTDFRAKADSDQIVTVPLKRGRNVLVFSVDGMRTDGKRGTDKDRLVLIVP